VRRGQKVRGEPIAAARAVLRARRK
jgi:hypothetical protein